MWDVLTLRYTAYIPVTFERPAFENKQLPINTDTHEKLNSKILEKVNGEHWKLLLIGEHEVNVI